VISELLNCVDASLLKVLLTSAQRASYVHCIGCLEWAVLQSLRDFAVNENFDVFAYAILFIDHAKSNARKLSVQVCRQLEKIACFQLDSTLIIGIGAQWAGNVNDHALLLHYAQ
jgi:hypothetical protein